MTTEEPDHYATLQVAPTAEPAVIAAAYRALARRYHPDVAGAEGEAMMRRLNAAWEILGDPERRAAYDRERKARNLDDDAVPGAGPAGPTQGEPTRSDRRSSGSPTGSAAGPSTHGAAPPRHGPASPPPHGSAAAPPPYGPASPPPYGPAGPPPGRPQGSVLPFGLFRGWSLGEIARVDPGYLEWLEGKPEGRPYLREIDETLRAIGWRRPPSERRPAGGARRRWRFGPG